ncbi:YybH family protein [Emticicia soli]|uniref:YybH family protein n=1 Tax=Emticicia soli TaxID=2027878 RepID=A0ABW5JAL6_9BACT
MKTLLCALLMCSFFTVIAQSDNIETEINNQVWLPFIKTYGNLDAFGFMNLHTRDLIRVPVDAKKIYTFDEYSYNNQQNNEYNMRHKRKQAIEFSFEERIHNETTAYETGYYKITITESTGKISYFYGKFTVVLRKFDRRWKIALDSDTSKDITETMFLKGKKL